MPVAPRRRARQQSHSTRSVGSVRSTALGVAVGAALLTGLIALPGAAQSPSTVAPDSSPATSTTTPGYIVDADGKVVTTTGTAAPSGVTTTLATVVLPGGAGGSPTTKKAAKKRTTTKRSTTRSAPSTTTAKSVVALLPTTQPGLPSTQPGQSRSNNASASGVAVGKPTTTVASGPGVDPTITTMLAPSEVPNTVPDEVWAALRKCESNNRYDINTGNGYYGAYQFAAGTWARLGYKGLPHRAAPAVQDEAAKRLQAKAGWGQWPACSRKLGLR